MIVSSINAMDKNAPPKPAANLPKAVALMGFALVSSPKGYDFRFIVPSDVGPVMEKGLVPLGEGP